MAELAEAYLDLRLHRRCRSGSHRRAPRATGNATLDHRHFTAIRSRHMQAFTLQLGR
jgi:hypothetical protein